MNNKPSGTVTFLFSDIEASTQKWEKDADQMQIAFARQEEIFRLSMRTQGGYVYKMIGDAFQVAFDTALQGISAARTAQIELQSEFWGDLGEVRVRMALHTGVVEERENDYVGPVLNRVARLLNAGHGGQVLISQTTYELVRDILPEEMSLRYLGEYRLKDLSRPEKVYQLISSDLECDFPPLNSLDVYPHNLPLQLTSFIGREREIIEVKNLFNATRLVTLLGPGGAGKTRLALQLAADLVENFKHGVWFVELASVNDPGLIPQAVAGTLSLRDETQRPLVESIGDFVKEKEMLLILDNCEHLVDSCARLSEGLLQISPGLKILATSREALRIGGEHTFGVLSLNTPDPQVVIPIDSLSQYDAVRLFVDRTIAVYPQFKVNNENAPAVAEICYRLDGIPLAIELAAARVGVLSIDMLLERLDDRFRLLSKGNRTVLPRHQTLAAVIDWSYELLSRDERRLFERLGIFVGGWTLEAAEAICCTEGIEKCEILALLTSLVEKSLVQIDHSSIETRYRMLETVHEYAINKASVSTELDQLKKSFVGYYLELAEKVEQKAHRESDTTLPRKLALDLENFRTALTWSFAGKITYGDSGLRTVGALWIIWWTLGYLNEGRYWLERALNEFPQKGEPRAKVLTNAGCIAWQQGDYQIAEQYTLESIAIYRNSHFGNRWGLANAIHIHGHIAFDQKDYSRARKFFEECLQIFRELQDSVYICLLVSDIGNIDYHEGYYIDAKEKYEECLSISRERADQNQIAVNLLRLGNIYRLEKDYQGAGVLYEESLQILQKMQSNLELAGNLHRLGFVAQSRGEYQKAASLFSESLTMQKEMGNKQGIAECLAGLAGLAIAIGDFEKGVQLFAATENFLNKFGAPLGPADCAEWDRDLSTARRKLDSEHFSRLWQQGSNYSLEIAVAEANSILTLVQKSPNKSV